jgi:hypothetical protein
MVWEKHDFYFFSIAIILNPPLWCMFPYVVHYIRSLITVAEHNIMELGSVSVYSWRGGRHLLCWVHWKVLTPVNGPGGYLILTDPSHLRVGTDPVSRMLYSLVLSESCKTPVIPRVVYVWLEPFRIFLECINQHCWHFSKKGYFTFLKC